MRVASIIGKFYPMHLGHRKMIENVATRYDEVLVFVCYTHGETIPVDMREAWVKDAVGHIPNVKVLNILEQLGSSSDSRTSDYGVSKTWAKWIMKKYPMITHFVGSEEYVKMMAESVGIECELYDLDRMRVPVSATMVRTDFQGNKHLLASPRMENEYVYRVAIVGLDSCGKSTLSHALHHKIKKSELVNEYGRDYCALKAGPDDGVDTFINRYDLEQIAYGHHKLVIASVRNAWKKGYDLVISDTEHIVTQGFSQRYFNENNKVIQDMINFQHYDLYIYCPLLPLENDGTRRLVDEQERIENDLKLRKLFEDNVKDGKIVYLNSNLSEKGRLDVAYSEILKIKGEL